MLIILLPELFWEYANNLWSDWHQRSLINISQFRCASFGSKMHQIPSFTLKAQVLMKGTHAGFSQCSKSSLISLKYILACFDYNFNASHVLRNIVFLINAAHISVKSTLHALWRIIDHTNHFNIFLVTPQIGRQESEAEIKYNLRSDYIVRMSLKMIPKITAVAVEPAMCGFFPNTTGMEAGTGCKPKVYWFGTHNST